MTDDEWRMTGGRGALEILLLGPVAPEPAEGVGEDGAALLAGVAAVAEDELIIVAGEFQGGGHVLGAEGPVAVEVVEVVAAVLEEDADGLGGFNLADEGG